jgi:hypothetical protein
VTVPNVKKPEPARAKDPIAGVGHLGSDFVFDCSETWFLAGPQVSSRQEPNVFAMHPNVRTASNAVMQLLRDPESHLFALQPTRVRGPVQLQSLCYSVALEPLTTAEQLAVLQTALVDAGFSIQNHVPGIEMGQHPFDEWSALVVYDDVVAAGRALEEYVAIIKSLKAAHLRASVLSHAYEGPPAPEVSSAPVTEIKPNPARQVDPRTIRRPPSLLSSSEEVSRQSPSYSSHESGFQLDTLRQKPVVDDPDVAAVLDAGFLGRRGIGWLSDEEASSPRREPSLHGPLPPAFDDPMSQAPEYQSEPGALLHASEQRVRR